MKEKERGKKNKAKQANRCDVWIVKRIRYPTNQPTNRPTDTAKYRGALSQLKTWKRGVTQQSKIRERNKTKTFWESTEKREKNIFFLAFLATDRVNNNNNNNNKVIDLCCVRRHFQRSQADRQTNSFFPHLDINGAVHKNALKGL